MTSTSDPYARQFEPAGGVFERRAATERSVADAGGVFERRAAAERSVADAGGVFERRSVPDKPALPVAAGGVFERRAAPEKPAVPVSAGGVFERRSAPQRPALAVPAGGAFERRGGAERVVMPELSPEQQAGAMRLAQRIAQRDAELQAIRAGSSAARAGSAGSAVGAGPATPATPATPYSRFIPREELGNFAAWQPDSFGDSGRIRANVNPLPDAEALRLAEARAAAEAQAAAAQAEQEEREARAEALRQAYEDGYRQGREEGQAEIARFQHDFAVQTGVQVDGMLAALQHRLVDLEADLAQRVARIALDLARQVVRSDLVQNPATVVAVAQEALAALLVSARHVTLTLHPDDVTLVSEGAGELIAARGARLVCDRSMERGGCIVDSDIGLVDASIGTRWQRASGALGQDSSWAECNTPAPVRAEVAAAADAIDAAAAAPAALATVAGAHP
ncbi:MAG: hypothetical protein RIQ60_435 [Pseudomonadota bacterium]|jgi:flagellar assembly protein FliH